MGYYTDFKVDVINSNETVDNAELAEKLSEISGYDFDDDLEINAKWYEYDEHMIKLSILYPNLVFQVGGNGEESDDIWRTYYKNGKSHDAKAKITYESYNERLLK